MTLKKSAPLKMIPSDGFGSFDWRGRPATNSNAKSVPILGTSVDYDSQSKSEKANNENVIVIPKNWSGIGRPTALPQKMVGLTGSFPTGLLSSLKSSLKASLEAKDVWAGVYTLPTGGSTVIGKDTVDSFSGSLVDSPEDWPDFTLTTHWSRQTIESFTGNYIGREFLYIVSEFLDIGTLAIPVQGVHETTKELTLPASYTLPRLHEIARFDEDQNIFVFNSVEHFVSRFDEAISKDAAYYASLSAFFQRFSLKCLCYVDTNAAHNLELLLDSTEGDVTAAANDFVNAAKSAISDVFPDVTFMDYDSSGDTSGLGASAAGTISGWISGFYT